MAEYNITGKSVIVTGAGGGIGSATTRAARPNAAHTSLSLTSPRRVSTQSRTRFPPSVSSRWPPMSRAPSR